MKVDNNLLYLIETIGDNTIKHLVSVLPKYDSKTITISDVNVIDRYAFMLNEKLTEVIVDSANAILQSDAFTESINIKKVELKNIGSNSLPSDLFGDCLNLNSIELPEGLKKIEPGAFYGCMSLKNINIPSSVADIGIGAFQFCTSLKSIDISNIQVIKSELFKGCHALSSITFSENLKIIEHSAFENTNLKDIKIPDSVSIIEYNAFQDCRNLKKIELGKGTKSLGRLFLGCYKLEKVIISASVNEIHEWAFSTLSLVDVEIDSSNPYFEAKDHVIIDKETNIVIGSYGTLPETFEVPESVIYINSLLVNKKREKIQGKERLQLRVSAAIVKYPKSYLGKEESNTENIDIKPDYECYGSDIQLISDSDARSYDQCDSKIPDEYYFRFHRGITSPETALTVVAVILFIAIIVLIIVIFFIKNQSSTPKSNEENP